MRVFIGIRISDEIKEKIGSLGKKIKEKIREAKLVSPQNLHITLKFLGEVKEEKVEKIGQIIKNISSSFAPFDLEVKGIGRFPEKGKVRVLWIGAEAKDNLRNLNKIIEEKLEELSFPRENRFKEHITVARFKSNPNMARLGEFLERYKENMWGKMRVENVEIIESILKPDGPVYRTLRTFKLGGEKYG